MPGPTLLKIGGSLLTDKGRESTFRPEAAARLMAEVAQARVPTVLVHGAGSFGHPQAARLRLDAGPPDPRGVAALFASLAQLEAHVLEAARQARLPALPVSLQDAQLRRGRLRWDAGLVRQALADGFVPVVHGSLVRSGSSWAVAGGDLLVAHLAAGLRPAAAIWATDVDGVLDRDPRDPAARLLPRVERGWSPPAAGGTGADVTGRMAGKLEQAREAARHARTLVLNGNAPGRVLAALQGRPVVASEVVR